MSKKNISPAKPFELNMLDNCLDRLLKIGKRQPLPTQHFYVEAQDIVRDSIVAAYNAGVQDGETNTKTFPIDDYKTKS